MNNVIFSIVAKNYIPMANALGNSLQQIHPDIPYFIIVADREDGMLCFDEQQFPIIPATALGIDQLEKMAFKYTVTEFCTALKPFAFAYFFREGYKRAIYFDPDIYVFSSLGAIFEQLNQSSIVVTPHVCTLQQNYTGIVPEGMLMHVGIFNFGFCAIANSENGRRVIEWWKIRLVDQCYADKIDGLHTDQKWMDFLPSLIDDLYIERGLGYNMAIWNWHERQIENEKGKFWVVNRFDQSGLMPLVFFHFSNFNFSQAANLLQFRPKYLEPFPDLLVVSDFYANQLVQQSIEKYSQLYKYSYNHFNNGAVITLFHRRLFRRLLEAGYTLTEPFNSQAGSFYKLLKSNELLSKSTSQNERKENEENYKDFDKKLKYIQKAAKLIKKTIGFDKYALLCKFAQRFTRPENQTFLIRETHNTIPFYNENRYINWQKTKPPIDHIVIK